MFPSHDRGGVDKEHTRIKQTKKYKNWQQAVYKKDKWECQRCGKHGGNIVAHHIKLFSEFPKERFNINNGITLCRPCHAFVHKTKDKKYLYVK